MQRLVRPVALIDLQQVCAVPGGAPTEDDVLVRWLLVDQDGELLEALRPVVAPGVFTCRACLGTDHQTQVFDVTIRNLTGRDKIPDPRVVETQQLLEVLQQSQQYVPCLVGGVGAQPDMPESQCCLGLRIRALRVTDVDLGEPGHFTVSGLERPEAVVEAALNDDARCVSLRPDFLHRLGGEGQRGI